MIPDWVLVVLRLPKIYSRPSALPCNQPAAPRWNFLFDYSSSLLASSSSAKPGLHLWRIKWLPAWASNTDAAAPNTCACMPSNVQRYDRVLRPNFAGGDPHHHDHPCRQNCEYSPAAMVTVPST